MRNKQLNKSRRNVWFKSLSTRLILLMAVACPGLVASAAELDIPDNFQLHYYLAHHYIERADFDLAELELKQAISKS